jgi:WD40 repeat protein
MLRIIFLAIALAFATTEARPQDESTLPTHLRTTLQVHNGRIRAVSFTPDSRLLATVGDSNIRLWDVESGNETTSWSGHRGLAFAATFASDGKTLATGGGAWEGDGEVKLWDVENKRELRTLNVKGGPVLSLAFAPNGRWLAVGNGRIMSDLRLEGTVTLWDLTIEEEQRPIELFAGECTALAYSPDGSRLAASVSAFDATSGRNDWELSLLDVASGRPVAKLFSMINEPADDLVNGALSSVAFSPNGKLIAACGHRGLKGFVRVWDVETGGIWITLLEQPGVIWTVAFSPDSSTIATAGNFQSIKLWDAATGQEKTSLDCFTGGVFALAFSPDGRHLVAGGSQSDESGENQVGVLQWWTRADRR